MATILVTGGNAGIGLATALEFADHGIDVFLCGRRRDTTAAAAAAVRARGVHAVGIVTDVTDPAGVEKLFEIIDRESGTLHYAFNCAGLEQVMGTYEAATLDDYERIFATSHGCLTVPPTRRTDMRGSVAGLLAARLLQTYIKTYN